MRFNSRRLNRKIIIDGSDALFIQIKKNNARIRSYEKKGYSKEMIETIQQENEELYTQLNNLNIN